MDYKNEICAGCQKAFEDGDDIVVCPECGTPQHRECYQKENKCVNSHLHAEGFSWEKSEKSEEAVPENTQNVNVQSEEQGGTVPLFDIEANTQRVESFIIESLGENKDKQFDGINASDAAIYLQTGAGRYIRRFSRANETGRKITWNWGAFFFAPAWFFYRRLYKAGLIFLAAVVALQLFMLPVSQKAYDILEKITPQAEESMSSSDYMSAVEQLSQDEEYVKNEKEFIKQSLILFGATFLIPNLIAALSADTILRKKMKKDIEISKHDAGDARTEKFLIMQRGGISYFLFFAAFMAQQYLATFLVDIGHYISGLF